MNKTLRKYLLALGLYDVATDIKYLLNGTQKKHLQLYSKFVQENDLCFDIGANVGRRTAVLVKLGARVIAVEPQPYCVKILKRKYADIPNVVVVEKALGEKKGQAEMMICDSHSLSSLSKDWIEKVRKSGRYADCDWQGKVAVETETLDDLIATYGKPAFVKVDVEGYEEEVIQGLSQPVNYMCFEFTPEFIESAIGGVRHLARLGKVVFNYCSGTHPFKLALYRWVDAEQICSILEAARNGLAVGDVYARFEN